LTAKHGGGGGEPFVHAGYRDIPLSADMLLDAAGRMPVFTSQYVNKRLRANAFLMRKFLTFRIF
jgi:hypothetical protein